MMSRSRLLVLVLIFVATAGALAAVTLRAIRAPTEPVSSAASAVAIGGPFTLQATDGRTVTDRSFSAKWMAVFFGYTFCPDACPTALSNMTVALEKLGSAASQLQPLFITVDPKRDTVPVLAEYLKNFDPRILGLSGSEEDVDRVAKAYRVYVSRPQNAGDDYLVDHSAYFYVMNPHGKFVNVVAGSTPGDQMADELRALMQRPGT